MIGTLDGVPQVFVSSDGTDVGVGVHVGSGVGVGVGVGSGVGVAVGSGAGVGVGVGVGVAVGVMVGLGVADGPPSCPGRWWAAAGRVSAAVKATVATSMTAKEQRFRRTM